MKSWITIFLCTLWTGIMYANVITFYVETDTGYKLSGVDIRITDVMSAQGVTKEFGFITIDPKVDEFRDLTISVHKAGWTVISPADCDVFTIDYRDKASVVKIIMKKRSEIIQERRTPKIVLGEMQAPAQYAHASASNTLQAKNPGLFIVQPASLPLIRWKVQVLASDRALTIIEKQKIGLLLNGTLIEEGRQGDSYRWKYSVVVEAGSIQQASNILDWIRTQGFSDAFVTFK
jgi:hypothetical protein